MISAFVLLGVAQVAGSTPPVVAPRVYPVESTKPEMRSTCLAAGVARGASIVAIGAYEGGLPLSELATEQGHRLKSIAVSAASRGRPLVLILSAYDPVLWDLRRVPKQRLRAVYVSGHHAQAVTGSGRSPIRVNTHTKLNLECGDPVYAYKGGSNLDELDSAVHRLFGRRIDRFIGNYSLKLVSIDGRAGSLGPAPLNGAIGAAAFKTGRSVDGPFGMRRLLAQGKIRRATAADVQSLARMLTRKSKTGRLAPVKPYIILSETYVVLRPIQVPTGMYGAHSATFLLPPGMGFPQDPGSHNTYWSLGTAECRGVTCGMDD